MSNEAHVRLMHAVLDGEASPAERDELVRLLAGDAQLRADYEKLQNLSAALKQVVRVEPPATLLQSLLANVQRRFPNKFVGADQLLSQQSVIGIHAANGGALPERKQRPIANFLNTIWETVMGQKEDGLFAGSKGKFLIGGGVAAAAVLALTSQMNFPSEATDTAGTISPAVRYRADQPTGAQIQVPAAGSATAPGSAADVPAGTVAAVERDAAAREAAMKDAMSRDARAVDAASRDARSVDAAARDARAVDAASKEARSLDAAARDARAVDAASRDARSLDAASRDAKVIDAAAKDAASRDAAARAAASRDAASRDAAAKDARSLDAAARDAKVIDAAAREAAARDAAAKDAASREARAFK